MKCADCEKDVKRAVCMTCAHAREDNAAEAAREDDVEDDGDGSVVERVYDWAHRQRLLGNIDRATEQVFERCADDLRGGDG